MGWLDKLLAFFREQDPNYVEAITLNELEDWLSARKQEIVRRHKLDESLKLYLTALNEKRWILEYKIDEWNKRIKIPDASKRDYIMRMFTYTRRLLEVVSDLQNPLHRENNKRAERFMKSLEKLLRKLEGSFFMHDYGFLEEKKPLVNPLFEELMFLRTLMNDFSEKLTSSGMKQLWRLEEKAYSLIATKKEIDDLEKTLSAKRTRHSSTKQKVELKKSELKKKTTSSSYLMYSKAKTKRDEIKKQIKLNNDKINSLFSSILHLLEEYNESHNSGNVEPYLQNAPFALQHDEGLTILHTLSHLKALLLTEKLNVDDKQEQLTLVENAIARLPIFHTSHMSLVTELGKIEQPEIDAMFLEQIEDIQYRLDHFQKTLQQLGDSIHHLEIKSSRTKERHETQRQMFENIVRIGLQRQVSITL